MKMPTPKIDIDTAIEALLVANRNPSDGPACNLAIAVALSALGVPKEQILPRSVEPKKFPARAVVELIGYVRRNNALMDHLYPGIFSAGREMMTLRASRVLQCQFKLGRPPRKAPDKIRKAWVQKKLKTLPRFVEVKGPVESLPKWLLPKEPKLKKIVEAEKA
jgi:hypothetical protein